MCRIISPEEDGYLQGSGEGALSRQGTAAGSIGIRRACRCIADVVLKAFTGLSRAC
jgi:hypothetical protein